jgi:hypothetical protein
MVCSALHAHRSPVFALNRSAQQKTECLLQDITRNSIPRSLISALRSSESARPSIRLRSRCCRQISGEEHIHRRFFRRLVVRMVSLKSIIRRHSESVTTRSIALCSWFLYPGVFVAFNKRQRHRPGINTKLARHGRGPHGSISNVQHGIPQRLSHSPYLLHYRSMSSAYQVFRSEGNLVTLSSFLYV